MEIAQKASLWPLRMPWSAGSEAAQPECCVIPAGLVLPGSEQPGAGWSSRRCHEWVLPPVRSPLAVSMTPDCTLLGAASPLPTALVPAVLVDEFWGSRSSRLALSCLVW